MRVHCTSNEFSTIGDVNAVDHELTIGEEYTVLEVISGHTFESPSYRLLDDSKNSPALHLSRNFEISDTQIPANWGIKLVPPDVIWLGPISWQKNGFWESFFDGERWAKTEYEQELAIILSS